MPEKYLVRQYRPAFFSDFDNEVVCGVPYDEITKAPWMTSANNSGFKEYKIEPYGNGELVISACYENGEHLVVAFALPENSTMMSNNGDLMRDNWRYKPHKS